MYCTLLCGVSCDKFVFSFSFGQCNTEMDKMSTRQMDGKQCEPNLISKQVDNYNEANYKEEHQK